MGLVWIAGGKCGDQEQYSAARMDASQHRQHEGPDETPGLYLRLVPRGYHLLPGILPLEPVVFSEALRTRIGLSQEEQSELVSKVRNRPGQRAGIEQRVLLAPRGYARRAA